MNEISSNVHLYTEINLEIKKVNNKWLTLISNKEDIRLAKTFDQNKNGNKTNHDIDNSSCTLESLKF